VVPRWEIPIIKRRGVLVGNFENNHYGYQNIVLWAWFEITCDHVFLIAKEYLIAG